MSDNEHENAKKIDPSEGTYSATSSEYYNNFRRRDEISYTVENRDVAEDTLNQLLAKYQTEREIVQNYGTIETHKIMAFSNSPGGKWYFEQGVRMLSDGMYRVKDVICSEEVSKRLAAARKKGRVELSAAVLDAVLLALSGPTVVTIAAIIVIRGHEQICSEHEYDPK